jgi:hypothetical protein
MAGDGEGVAGGLRGATFGEEGLPIHETGTGKGAGARLGQVGGGTEFHLGHADATSCGESAAEFGGEDAVAGFVKIICLEGMGAGKETCQKGQDTHGYSFNLHIPGLESQLGKNGGKIDYEKMPPGTIAPVARTVPFVVWWFPKNANLPSSLRRGIKKEPPWLAPLR